MLGYWFGVLLLSVIVFTLLGSVWGVIPKK